MMKIAATMLMLSMGSAMATFDNGNPITIGITLDEAIPDKNRELEVLAYVAYSDDKLATTNTIKPSKGQTMEAMLNIDATQIHKAHKIDINFSVILKKFGYSNLQIPCLWSNGDQPRSFDLIKDDNFFDIKVMGTDVDKIRCEIR